MTKIIALVSIIAYASVIHLAHGYIIVGGDVDSIFVDTTKFDMESDEQEYHRRMEGSGTDEENNLQGVWWNWNLCTNAGVNDSFTPMNELVPDSYVFLVDSPENYITENNITTCGPAVVRTGNISAGIQTVFASIYATIAGFDVTDDWESGECSQSVADTDATRYYVGNFSWAYGTSPEIVATLVSNIDGIPTTPVALYNGEPYYLEGCSDNRTYEEFFKLYFGNDYAGDTCDEEPYQSLTGLDTYPLTGWWLIDTREWDIGEEHTYEFGTSDSCNFVKYVLTAVDPNEGLGFLERLWNRMKEFFDDLFG